MKNRCLILILDMVAGHWDADITTPLTGLEPPNILGYVNAGKLPVFKECMEKGIFVNSWNMGICNTPHGQKYLASGTYKTKSEPGGNPYWKMINGLDSPTILSSCKLAYPQGKVAAFGSDAWMQSGWWKAPDCTMGWGSYFSDFLTSQHAFNWMQANPDWKMTLLYLAQYDKTGNCPLFKKDAAYTNDKHHSLLQLDKYLWQIKLFLEEMNWWDETWLFIGSDHGCHYGCDVAVAEGRKRGIPEQDLSNYCANHQEPYDCFSWDFKKNQSSGKRLDCARRTLFIISGGALDKTLHGQKISRGEIIDFAPTIASAMGIDFKADGKSLL
ncbi:MAG: hypothetical protein A2096_05015 [Spirochaetes bacterium GWF1_41_5]|nr:MAG: hypothetical protein A2096_05015 [Spirochaetes bacterium GWF1_41_5]HBE03197.1 hypothetical protein [Spirochaetia bacterium]